MPPRTARSQPTDPATILPALLRSVESSPYAAHQKSRTTAARLLAGGHQKEAAEVLFELSKALLKKDEWGSGVDLGIELVKVWEGAGVVCDETTRGQITHLIALCPPTANWRKSLIDPSLAWAAKHHSTPSPASDPLLQQYVGHLHLKERSFLLAEKHLLLSGTRDAGRLLGELAFDWSSGSSTGDPSAYLLRITLPFLLESPPNILPFKTALATFLSLLLSRSPELLVERIPLPAELGEGDLLCTTLPAVNWIQLVGFAVQRAGAEDSQETWAEINKEYRRLGKPLLKDPAIKAAVAAIGQQTFGLAPPKGAGGNGLMDLMGSLFG